MAKKKTALSASVSYTHLDVYKRQPLPLKQVKMSLQGIKEIKLRLRTSARMRNSLEMSNSRKRMYCSWAAGQNSSSL